MKLSELVSVVEVGYSSPEGESAWLAGVIDTMRPLLDSGLGVFGWLYDASDFSALKFDSPTFRGVDPKIPEALFAVSKHPDCTTALTRLHYRTPAGPFSFSLGKSFADYTPWHLYMPPLGVRDLVVLNGIDPNRRGCALLAPRKSLSRMMPARRALLARVAAHLASGLRLFRRLKADAASPAAQPAAVLDASGKLQHAAGDAADREPREALERAAKAMDRARGKLRRIEPEESLRIWQAMVNGRWTLVDKFDSDGKHFLVAHMNEPTAPAVSRLTTREQQIAAWAGLGHSNKLIAYELGISEPVVSKHLASATQKLGLRRSIDLARVFPDALRA